MALGWCFRARSLICSVKGDDSFMSPKQFETFYWPSLRKVIRALINEGVMVVLLAEGSYQNRLNLNSEFPKDWVSWHFYRIDIVEAKKVIGNSCCIIGNVPSSIMITAAPAKVSAYCRDLIEKCAPNGGFILAVAAWRLNPILKTSGP